MYRIRWRVIMAFTAMLAAASAAIAQQTQQAPHIGYIYPAGGRQGADFEVTIGGQFLDGVSEVIASGGGLQATIVKHKKPLSPKQANELREKLEEAQKRIPGLRKNIATRLGRDNTAALEGLAKQIGVTAEELTALAEYRKRFDPKRQLNPQIAETVIVQIKLAADAQAGQRELRLLTSAGLTNPLCFCVGQWPEYRETEPNDKTAESKIGTSLPAIVNGQILPGDVDRFSFEARKGDRLVIAVSARQLIPYLADAVPGWFQATLSVLDADGKEVAFADDYRFSPDPTLLYEVPSDGTYTIEIKDAIYRGREDFIYRITIGQVPYVTSIFPLGARAGSPVTIALEGWNLPTNRLSLATVEKPPGIHLIAPPGKTQASNRVPFAIDTLPEYLDAEPNDEAARAQQIKPPLVVNGRIDRSGDWDIFRFDGRAGGQVAIEVQSRRLGSPLDCVLKLTDAAGSPLMVNDDFEDKGTGLLTHHADSRLLLNFPADGAYYLHLGDAQSKGGIEYGYRLRISAQRPDFELRIVPSSINARAGATVPVTAYALRRDGFAGEIALALLDPPPGFTLSGGRIAAEQDQVRLTLTVPPTTLQETVCLNLEGRATIQGNEVRRTAVPAEDMMQAFAYHHLVPAQQWMISVAGSRWARPSLKLVRDETVKLPAGGTARVEVSAPGRMPLDQVQLALSEAPEGVALKDVKPNRKGAAIVLTADASSAKPGTKGNLIIEAFWNRASGDDKSKPAARRVPLGVLPAISFEIVEPRAKDGKK